MSNQDTLVEFNSVLEEWKSNHSTGADPIPTLKRLAELIEHETEAYFKMDPDPFDDRHPGRANPTCTLGHLMKSLFKNEEFMNQLVGTYLMSGRDKKELHTLSCRLLLDVMPGLETSVVFQENEGVVEQLFEWAENAENPLSSYATGLLAGAMDLQDIASNFKEQNSILVPLMLQRLHALQKQQMEESLSSSSRDGDDNKRYFSMFGKDSKSPAATTAPSPLTLKSNGEQEARQDEHKKILKRVLSPSHYSDDVFNLKPKRIKYSPGEKCVISEADQSNSSWAEMQPYVIGSYSMEPLTTSMKQRMILQYLTPMGEYQELLGTTFEHSALDLIFFYINLKENRDVRLAFEALKYLATLLCHKKFAIEFLSVSGVQRLLEVPRPSMAATGVSLCVYYLSYFEDAMERVCLLPDNVLSDLVGYVMWLMECSHDSSRCHAAMFFSQVFPFKVMLDLFDQKDGLRRLFNVISTLSILNVDERSSMLTEDQVFTMQQAARHVCGALKKYFEAHQALKADEIRRSHMRSDGAVSPVQETPAYKPMKLTPEVIQDNTEVLMELLPLRSNWVPEETFHNLGGIQLLTQLVAMAPEWSNYPGKPETIKNALDAIAVCMVTPRSQSILLESVCLPDDITTPAISVIIGLAEGEILADAEVQKSALTVLVNCVCGPIERVGGGVSRIVGSGPKKKLNWKQGEDILSRVWNGIRTNNGIMVLLKLLSTKTPITDADIIRGLACRALVGLSRSESVRQIINKLPLFNNGQLQSLMKEPVLQDKRQEHIRFCKYASDLLERVSGKQPSSVGDASLEEIRRADIVAQTKIIFQERELLQLMYDHLLVKGFTESAFALQREAGLPRCVTPPPLHPSSPHLYSSPSTSRLSRQMSQPSTSHTTASVAGSSSHTNHARDVPTTPGPIRLTVNKHQPSPPQVTFQQKVQLSKLKYLREKENSTQSPSVKLKSVGKPSVDYDISLDKIVTEYLRKQHALCRNPVVTCPPMSLFLPHRCPEPKGWSSAPVCITSRLMRRSVFPPYGGLDGTRSNRKFIYTKFRPVRTYHDGEDDGFACCSFMSSENQLMLGTFSGELKMFSLSTGEETASFSCHSSPIIQLEPSRDDKMILTSTWGTRQDCSLWRYERTVENVFTFDDHYSEFSKSTQDKIIGTRDEVAHIYDVACAEPLQTLHDADKANNYKANIATFNPTDELVLNDGVLWDVRAPRALHKFDKFNSYISGVFHPMGLEIIINSEVWDIRTFHLLHTVPALDQCQIKFNHTGDVIYATRFDDNENLEDRYRSQYGSTLRTFDATDYSSIGTMDLKTKSIFDLCTDKSDCFLAVVENQQFSETGAEESVCRLYEVGKLRDAEDDQEEEEEEEEEVGGDEDDDDDDEDDDDDISNIVESLGDGESSDDNQDEGDEGGDNAVFEAEEFSPSSDDLADDDDDDLDDDLLFDLV
ncbi:DDB1- and CUL4-associated factor 1-like [Gigantopelta aegis]|uniref:DDB1- and CUL4-associated factor 1-like n=1 Tax=Gigantopelta aegis TaxID=1735272 RepID=UPI001B8885C3|nr:DDB1- and CUL4-associated factor 1-like [Gigantopelta aegis]